MKIKLLKNSLKFTVHLSKAKVSNCSKFTIS